MLSARANFDEKDLCVMHLRSVCSIDRNWNFWQQYRVLSLTLTVSVWVYVLNVSILFWKRLNIFLPVTYYYLSLTHVLVVFLHIFFCNN